MKKKILALTCILLLTGCSANTNTPSISDEISDTPDASSSSSSENDSAELDVESEITTFGMSSSDISSKIFNEQIDGYSVSIDDYDVDVFPYENYLLYCVRMSNEESPILIYIYDQKYHGTAKYSEALLQEFLSSLDIFPNVNMQNVSLDNGFLISCAWIPNSHANDFPLSVKYLPQTDYFLSCDIDEYNAACIEGRYDDLFADINTYINTSNPPTYDSAYSIQAALSPIMEYWDELEVMYDPVENFAQFYCANVTDLDNNIHFVPYAASNERNIHARIGFYSSDWLFFDNIIITASDNLYINCLGSKKIEDVTQNGSVLELYNYTFDDDDDLAQLLTTSDHIIRFSSHYADESVDYEMSEEEFTALKRISNFQGMYNFLSDLRFNFELRMK